MVLTCPFCHARAERNQTTCAACGRTMTRHCPSCAESISVAATLCKYCGETVTPTGSAERPASKPSTPEIEFIEETPRRIRWENKASGGVFRRWWATWAESVFHPRRFWESTPARRGHLAPILYAWFGVAQILMLLLPLVFFGGVASACDGSIRWTGPMAVSALYLALYPATLIATAVGTYVWALLWHVPLKILGARGTFETTLRAVAYNSGSGVLTLIPLAGLLVAPVWNGVMNYHAFRASHRMGRVGAVLGALLPYGMVAALLAGAALAVGFDAEPFRASMGCCGR